MASLYKKPVFITDPKTRKRIKTRSKKWWGRYRDENGLEKRVPLAADKTAAQTMLHDLVVKVERRVAGIEDPFEKHRKRPLNEHLTDFKASLHDDGNTQAYAVQTAQRVRDIVASCKFERIDQISASRAQEALAKLRANGMSVASSNHYLRAIKMFSRWLVRDRRANDDRLAHLSKMNADVDRRRVRRPLSIEEFGRMLQAAERGPSIQGVDGRDRAVAYIVGAYTGYRRNEIGSVTEQSFDFNSDPPTLTVEAGYSKRRRTDVIPLRADFANRIQTWIASKPLRQRNQSLFHITNKRTAEMIRKDMTAARTTWLSEAATDQEREAREKSSFLLHVDQNGFVVDFHALRKTFITNLTQSGAAPKTAQLLARHSDINLTMNTYTMLGVHDQASAVEALPPIPAVSPDEPTQRALATGTDGRNMADERPKKVPPVVPRGAENGAERLASTTLRIAPTCTETAETSTSPRALANAKSSEETGVIRAVSQRTASDCINSRGGDRTRTGITPNRILSPVRLPISPLGRVWVNRAANR